MLMQRFSCFSTALSARSSLTRSIRTIAMTFGFLGASSAAIAAPDVIGTCDTVSAVEVEATAGTLGPTGYTTLKLAFDAINAGTHQGAINVEVCLSTTEGTTPATLNSSGAGAAAYTAVGVRPLVDGLTITGNPATGFGVIQLKGADNVTIDGDNPNTAGTNRDLTINNTNTTTAIAGSVIRIATSTVASTVISADNNTIRNLVLNGNVTNGNAAAITLATSSSNSSFVIYAGGNGGASATDAPTAITSVTANTAISGTTINNLVISNNAINQAARAIVFNGAAASVATTLTISDNLIGAAGSLVGAPPFTAPASTVYTKGIWINGANGISVSGNSLRNILSFVATTMTGVELVGAIGASVNISNNTINGLAHNGGASATKGIQISSATGTYTVAGNTISNVQSLGGASGTAGMDLGGTATSAVVERNRISNVYNRNTVTFGAWGLSIGAGTAVTVRNNFISDVNGVMTGGGAFSTTFGIHGLRIAGGTGHQIHNNTVNLSGALLANGSTVLTSACTIVGTGQTGIDMRNNICANTLSGAVASTSHVSLFLPSAATSAMNLTLNNNDYFSGPDPATQGIAQVGTTFGTTNFLASNFNAAATVPATNLRSYTDTLRATTGNDSATIVTDPILVSASDLHLTVGSPAQNTGATIPAVANDIDQQLRPGGAGYDIGADEVDGIPPPANDLRATSLIDPSNGSLKPVSVAFTPQASFTNLGTNTQSSVTVRYRILDGAMVEVYNQTATIASIAFNASQTVSFPAATINTVGTYSTFARGELVGDSVPANDEISGTVQIQAPLSGAYTVGTGGSFTSLTNAGGLFQTLNGLGASTNITVTVVGDSTAETGANALNQISGGFTLSIQPSGNRIVSGTGASALLDFNGADGVTIDGLSTTGGPNSLLIRNASALSAIRFINDASSNIIRNTTIESGGTGTVVVISTGVTTGNDDIQIVSNIIRDRTDVVAVPFNAMGSFGTSAVITNTNLTIANNRIINFANAGLIIQLGSENTSITGNDFSQTAVRATALAGINVVSALGTNLISRNNIHDFVASGTAGVTGLAMSDARGTTVSRNRIYNFPSTAGATGPITGILFTGSSAGAGNTNVTVVNNMITIAPTVATTQVIRGLFDFGFASNVFTADFNSIYVGGAETGASSSWGLVRGTAAPTAYSAQNNLVFNNRTGGTGNHFAGGDQSANTGTFVSNFNFFAGTGATAANFMDYGVAAAGTPVSFATYQAGPPTREANSIAGVASSFVASDIFVDFANGDLHLKVTSPQAVNVGSPVATTTDFDNETRSLTTPEIGADELSPPNTAPVITPTAGGITRQQGTAASNSQIAVVSDTETAAGSLVVTTQGALPTGISVSNIVNSAGNITADVAASCSAATGANLVGLRVTDAGALFTDANLTVNVAVNTAPVLGTYPASNATTGIGTTVTPNAAPTDNGSIASITASAPGFTGSFSVNTSSGVVTVTNPGPANVYTVTVTATDDCGQPSVTTFQLTVSNTNAAPVITPAATLTRQRGSAASNGALATVTDDTPAQNVVVTAQTVPAGLTVTGITNTAGAITGNVAASCTATLGSNIVVLRATDPGTLFTDGNLTVDVTANTTVVQGTYPATSVIAGASTTVTPDAAPTDNGSITSMTAAAPGFSGTFSVNTSTGVVTVTNAGPGGVFTVTVTATDNCNTTSTSTFALTVNAQPTIAAAAVTLTAGDAAAVRTIANVSDNEDPENTLAVTINGGSSSTNNGVTVGSIAVDAAGIVTANVVATCIATNASFTLRVTDSTSLFREATLNTVVTANTAPLLSYGTTTLPAGAGVVIGPSAGPTDSGAITSIAVQSVGTYTGGVTVAPSGNVTLTSAAPVGSHTLTIRATDNCGTTTDAGLLVTVIADELFANGFEDITRTPAKMKLAVGEEGVVQTLVLPMFELQDLAGARDIVDVVEFEIGTTRSLLQVRGVTGYREMRLLDIDSQGSLRTVAWMEMSGQAVLKLQWRARTEEGVLHVQTVLTAVPD